MPNQHQMNSRTRKMVNSRAITSRSAKCIQEGINACANGALRNSNPYSMKSQKGRAKLWDKGWRMEKAAKQLRKSK